METDTLGENSDGRRESSKARAGAHGDEHALASLAKFDEVLQVTCIVPALFSPLTSGAFGFKIVPNVKSLGNPTFNI